MEAAFMKAVIDTVLIDSWVFYTLTAALRMAFSKRAHLHDFVCNKWFQKKHFWFWLRSVVLLCRWPTERPRFTAHIFQFQTIVEAWKWASHICCMFENQNSEWCGKSCSKALCGDVRTFWFADLAKKANQLKLGSCAAFRIFLLQIMGSFLYRSQFCI